MSNLDEKQKPTPLSQPEPSAAEKHPAKPSTQTGPFAEKEHLPSLHSTPVEPTLKSADLTAPAQIISTARPAPTLQSPPLSPPPASSTSPQTPSFQHPSPERKPRARGTAAMDPQTRREVARKGGLAVSRNKQHMAEIGRKGGQSVSKNREHMAQIGRKGGAASRGHRSVGKA